MFDIVDIDMRIDYSIFSNTMDEVIRDESSRTGISFDWASKKASILRSNTSVYKIIITNMDSSNKMEIVADDIGNDIVFKPFELRNFNETFYKLSYQDDDLLQVTLLALKKIALKAKGNFGCILDGQYCLVHQGRDISPHVKSVALVDDNGKIYSLKGGQKIDDSQEDDGMGYVPQYLINTWLEENEPFQNKLQSVPKTEQFELMGQFAIYQKRKDMITASQFRDLIIQIGTFADMVGGFKDNSLSSVYQFFV